MQYAAAIRCAVAGLSVLVVIACLPPSLVAQHASVRGVVTDAETGRPLGGVNVFIDQTTRGSATSADGRYEIEDVPPGEVRIVASMVGYETVVRTIDIVPEEASRTVDFALVPALVELGEVAVESEQPRDWRRNLRLFTRHFVGFSDRAEQVELVNPYVLDFENDGKLFRATARVPLVIENRALGYRLTAFLRNYTGTADMLQLRGPLRFEEMAPSDADQSDRWEEERKETYEGSLMHFLRSLVAGTLREEGFFAAHELRLGYNIERVEVGAFPFLEQTDKPYLYRLFFDHDLYVRHGREESRIRLTAEEVLIHEEGYVYGVHSGSTPPLVVSGAMSAERLADYLPRDYEP